MDRKLLVVGASEGSLGSHVARMARKAIYGWDVTTAGIDTEEEFLNLADEKDFKGMVDYHAIIVCAGINEPTFAGDVYFGYDLRKQLEVNAVGPLVLCNEWISHWRQALEEDVDCEHCEVPLNFAVVSSNSAHIARSTSAGYCASKAALSMGIRCLGRAVAGTPLSVFGYEPGWIEGTGMSNRVLERLQGAPPHRIPGNRVITPDSMAATIVSGMGTVKSPMNGCMLRLDGGEQ